MEQKRRYVGMALAVLLFLVTVLWGCQRSTTVILPPETLPTTASSGEGSSTELPDAPTTQPTAIPSSEPTSIPNTEPSTAPATEPTSAPTMNPPTAPTTEPTTAPTSEPSTAPTTEPTTSPTSEPATTPTAEPTAAPSSEPTVVPATEPPTVPTTDPEPTKHPVYAISGHTVGSLEYSLLDAINQQRAAADESLPPLTLDHTLCALAAIRAYECTESFSHTRPDGRGAYTVLADYDYYIWSDLEERIHLGSSGLSAGTIVKGWMYTSDFPANILSGDFTHIGIGIYENGGTTHIVCFFAG